jgi:hypothetical protein
LYNKGRIFPMLLENIFVFPNVPLQGMPNRPILVIKDKGGEYVLDAQ